MAYQITNRGVGDLATTAYCAGWARYLDPFCWSFNATQAASQAAVYGDKYAPPPSPPPVGSTLPDGSPIPAVPPVEASPELTAVNAGQMAASISNKQISDWQAANQQFFEDLNQELNPPPGPSGINWWLIGGIAAGVLVVGAVAGGGRR